MPLNSAERMAHTHDRSDTTSANFISSQSNQIEDATKIKFIENYSEILAVIGRIELHDTCTTFRIENRRNRNGRFTMTWADCLLSTIIIRGGEECLKLLEKISYTEKYRVLTILEQPGKQIPADFREKYSNVTSDVILNFRQYIETEVEVCTIIIPLVEYKAISISKYAEIRNLDTKNEQRKHLVDVISDQNDVNQINRFLFVLHVIGREDILNVLLTRMIHDDVGDLQVGCSGTTLLLTIPSYPDMQTTENDYDEAVENILDLRLDDAWAGSIVLRLYSKSDNISSTVFFQDEEKLKLFLQKMYINVKLEPNERKVFEVEIKIIPKHKFIEHRKQTRISSKQQYDVNDKRDSHCSMCLQEIVRKNVKPIVDEIESDIIEETFDKVEDVSKFVKDRCLSVYTTPSRQQRAVRFLNYAIHKEECLHEFFKVFQRKSKAKLIHAECLKCSLKEESNPTENISTKQEFKMNFILRKEEGKNIVQRQDVCQTSIPRFRQLFKGDGSSKQGDATTSWERTRPFNARGQSLPNLDSTVYQCETTSVKHLFSIVNRQWEEIKKQSKEIVSLKECMKEESKKTDTLKNSVDFLITNKNDYRGESNAAVNSH